jgi:hypothetical protein
MRAEAHPGSARRLRSANDRAGAGARHHDADLEDGDPDLEEPAWKTASAAIPDGPGCPIATRANSTGDETTTTAARSDFIVHALWGGAPGCPIADPDYCEGERSCVRPNMITAKHPNLAAVGGDRPAARFTSRSCETRMAALLVPS